MTLVISGSRVDVNQGSGFRLQGAGDDGFAKGKEAVWDDAGKIRVQESCETWFQGSCKSRVEGAVSGARPGRVSLWACRVSDSCLVVFLSSLSAWTRFDAWVYGSLHGVFLFHIRCLSSPRTHTLQPSHPTTHTPYNPGLRLPQSLVQVNLYLMEQGSGRQCSSS